MDLQSLTYISPASPGIDATAVDEIHRAALTYNPLDGITGLLLFNGHAFLQVVEGAQSAIDDLMRRLSKDPRHGELDIRDRRVITERAFPNWSMHRIDVSPDRNEALAAVRAEFDRRLDGAMLGIIEQSLSVLETMAPRQPQQPPTAAV